MKPAHISRRKSWDDARLPPQFMEIRGQDTFLGRGTCGEVHRAWDSARDTYVAVKRSHTGFAASMGGEAYLAGCVDHEARVLAGLDHPHLPRALAHSRRRPANGTDRAYLVTELIEGADLHTAGLGDAPRKAMLGVLAGLAHAHRRGVVHGDIHPGNVMREAERAVLIDFDLATEVGASPREEAVEAIQEDFMATAALLTIHAQQCGLPIDEVQRFFLSPLMSAWRDEGTPPSDAALSAEPFFAAAEPAPEHWPEPMDVSRETSEELRAQLQGLRLSENGDAGSPAAL